MLNAWELQRYVKVCAKRGDMKVVFEKQCQPRTNGNTIYLPRPDPFTMTAEEFSDMRYFVAHETGHVLYSDFEPAITGKMIFGCDSALGFVMNLIEDHRNDHLNGAQYAGDRADCEAFMVRFANKFTGRDMAGDKEMEDLDGGSRKYSMAAALFGWDMCVRDYGTSAGLSLALQHLADPILSTHLAQYSDELRKLRVIEDKVVGTQASWDLACKIFEAEMGGNVQHELHKTAQPGGTGDHEAGEEEGKGAGNVSGNGQQAGDGEGEAARPEGEGIDTIKWEDLSPGPMDVSPSVNRRGLHIDYTNHTPGGTWIPTTEEEMVVVDHTTNNIPSEYTEGNDVDASVRIHLPEASTSESFAQKVRINLQVRSRTTYEYGLKRGKLNPRSLYRMGIDAPGLSERVFKAKRVSDLLDAAVTLLVDNSGSMTGIKYNHAVKSALLLNESIGNVLHIPLEILGFTTTSSDSTRPRDTWQQTTMFVHRAFSNTVLPEDELRRRMGHATYYMLNNADGEAISWAYDRLLRRHEKRKVLIVLSDGSPACSSRPDTTGDISTYTHNTIQAIEKAGLVDLYAIGIMDHNVEKLYAKHQTINSAEALETALLTLIDRTLTYGA